MKYWLPVLVCNLLYPLRSIQIFLKWEKMKHTSPTCIQSVNPESQFHPSKKSLSQRTNQSILIFDGMSPYIPLKWGVPSDGVPLPHRIWKSNSLWKYFSWQNIGVISYKESKLIYIFVWSLKVTQSYTRSPSPLWSKRHNSLNGNTLVLNAPTHFKK